MKKMQGTPVHNPNQFGNAWVAPDSMGVVSIYYNINVVYHELINLPYNFVAID